MREGPMEVHQACMDGKHSAFEIFFEKVEIFPWVLHTFLEIFVVSSHFSFWNLPSFHDAEDLQKMGIFGDLVLSKFVFRETREYKPWCDT